MGTSLIHTETNFTMTKARAAAAVAALKKDSSGDLGSDIADLCFDKADLAVVWDDKRGVTRADYQNEKEYQESEDFFHSLAPYVDGGSTIDVINEHGETYRFAFDGRIMVVQVADMDQAYGPDYERVYNALRCHIKEATDTPEKCLDDCNKAASKAAAAGDQREAEHQRGVARLFVAQLQTLRKVQENADRTDRIYLHGADD